MTGPSNLLPTDNQGEEPRRHRARLISRRLGVDSRHQQPAVSTVYIMARTPDLLPGTLDLLILRTLQNDALHGWAVSERIQQISRDVLQINQGSLYPALHRLEHQGWIEAEWKVSELGRRAKYYHLTASGRRQLAVEAREWERMATAIGRVRAKIKYRPVIFELMPDDFTLFELQRTVEAILGPHLHKQNFRRLVEGAGLVETTGEVKMRTGGRPAKLYRFRREVLLERPAPGVRVKPGKV